MKMLQPVIENRLFLMTAFFSSVIAGIIFLYSPPAFSQNGLNDLLQQLEKSERDTNRVWILRDIAYYHMDDDLDSAIHYSQRGFNLARDIGFVQGQIWNLYQKALALEFGDRFEEAIATYQDAYNISVVYKDSLSMAKLRNAMGVAYYYQSDYNNALNFYHEALALSEVAGYQEGESHALNNLGVIYRHRRNFKKALDIYLKSLEIKKTQKDTIGMVNVHYNIGLLYSYMQVFDKSLEAFSKAQKLAEGQKDERSMAEINVGLGVALYNLEKHQDAYDYLKIGIENLKSDKIHEKVGALTYLGILEVRTGKTDEGLSKLIEAKEIVEQTERLELKRQVMKELAVAYELLQQPEKSIESWKAFNILNDSINNEQKLWAFEEMQARFDAIEKDKKIQQQELELSKEKTKKARLMIFLTIAFLSGLAGIYYYVFRWRAKVKAQEENNTPAKPNGTAIDIGRINSKLLSPLTTRESEIIELVEKGMTNHEIAENLFVSENTVKTHLKNIFSKTHAINRTDLIHKLRNY
ncbi:LuxR family transcriptional regulator [Aquiflexum lacus]|uniref:LuxR family transcriptional regulator n=1 Tax=Aquiflexum lacus TaxID=2483805 RepID=UPI001894AD5C|nr:LuxR family transcriptional regulator [Aquiflexum lacus]